jgi:hypothetical protein
LTSDAQKRPSVPCLSRLLSWFHLAVTLASLGSAVIHLLAGDLDFEGTSYQASTWPDGSRNHPTAFRYIGPFTGPGHPYPQIQFESDAPASESLCDTTTGTDCVLKPLGSDFYPFWSLNNSQRLRRVHAPRAACVWNFGNVLPGVTKQTFGKDAQYGAPDLAVFGGTSISKVFRNPAVNGNCPSFNLK